MARTHGAAPYAGGTWVARGSDLPGAGDAFAFEELCDGAEADAGVVHLEDAADYRSGVGVGLERAELRAGGSLGAVRVRQSGVDEPVAVVGSAAEPPAGGREGHDGRPGAELGAPSLRFRQTAEQAHDEVVGLAVRVDLAADFWNPQLDAVVGEHREHELELRAGEGALWLADHQSVPVSRPAGGTPRSRATDLWLPSARVSFGQQPDGRPCRHIIRGGRQWAKSIRAATHWTWDVCAAGTLPWYGAPRPRCRFLRSS